jgi:hypothetical protein
VFAQGEFASRTQAMEVIQKTQDLLATLEHEPQDPTPAWEIVEAESLEAAQAQIALLGQPPSPN